MPSTKLDRILFLGTGLLAAYQVTTGIDKLSPGPILAFTIAFGILLLTSLFFLIFGLDGFSSPIPGISSTLIPLSMGFGLVLQHFLRYSTLYLVYTIVGLLLVSLTGLIRYHRPIHTITVTVVHGIAGLTICIVPAAIVILGRMQFWYIFVAIGGACIGLGGILFSVFRFDPKKLPWKINLHFFPALLFLMTLCYVLGFHFG